MNTPISMPISLSFIIRIELHSVSVSWHALQEYLILIYITYGNES